MIETEAVEEAVGEMRDWLPPGACQLQWGLTLGPVSGYQHTFVALLDLNRHKEEFHQKACALPTLSTSTLPGVISYLFLDRLPIQLEIVLSSLKYKTSKTNTYPILSMHQLLSNKKCSIKSFKALKEPKLEYLANLSIYQFHKRLKELCRWRERP